MQKRRTFNDNIYAGRHQVISLGTLAENSHENQELLQKFLKELLEELLQEIFGDFMKISSRNSTWNNSRNSRNIFRNSTRNSTRNSYWNSMGNFGPLGYLSGIRLRISLGLPLKVPSGVSLGDLQGRKSRRNFFSTLKKKEFLQEFIQQFHHLPAIS